MHQLQRVLGDERRFAGEHLAEGRAQRVVVGAVVDGVVHAAGLLR